MLKRVLRHKVCYKDQASNLSADQKNLEQIETHE